MKTYLARMHKLQATAVAGIALAALVLGGCASSSDSVERAQARVDAKEKGLADAEAGLTAASGAFCDASKTYILGLDQYGDVLTDTAPTVGDVRNAGADLVEPREDAFDGAEAAVEAQQAVVVAEQELADARAALERAQAGTTSSPSASAAPLPTPTPLAPEASVERVKQTEEEFADAQSAVTDDTTLTDASEQFNAAAVALEFAWLRLFADAGCLSDEQQMQAQAAVSAYTSALQQDLTDAGYYSGGVDGIYGPMTVAAVEALQTANELPVTGTVDRATADALQEELIALGDAEAEASLATTAAVQQTLKLLGFWDGPVDGKWSPELTEAVKEFQTELGVEPTGEVDAATIAAFEKALEAIKNPAPSATPEPTESEG